MYASGATLHAHVPKVLLVTSSSVCVCVGCSSLIYAPFVCCKRMCVFAAVSSAASFATPAFVCHCRWGAHPAAWQLCSSSGRATTTSRERSAAGSRVTPTWQMAVTASGTGTPGTTCRPRLRTRACLRTSATASPVSTGCAGSEPREPRKGAGAFGGGCRADKEQHMILTHMHTPWPHQHAPQPPNAFSTPKHAQTGLLRPVGWSHNIPRQDKGTLPRVSRHRIWRQK